MGKDVIAVEEKLLKVVPAEFKVDVHHWLILHDRCTCVRVNPYVVHVLSKIYANLKIKQRFNQE